MDAKMECFEIFKAQDPHTGDFDVVFEIYGKKLYAHRHRLNAISPTFKSMLSDRWNSNKEEPLQIKDYKFEDFKEFLTFIYSGNCNITDENIYDLLDMAEFYGVKLFKEACDKYLSKMEFSYQNIFQFFELADKYSLSHLRSSTKMYLKDNFQSLSKTEHFKCLDKSVLKNIVEGNQNNIKEGELFEAVFKWVENKAVEKQKVAENMILNDAIKEELSDMLPFFNFKNMKPEFLFYFVAEKSSFLFSGNEYNDIVEHLPYRVYVVVIDGNGNTMRGFLNCPEIDKVFKVIRSQKDISTEGYYWSTNAEKPSKPSILPKNKLNFEWSLVYDWNGNLAIKKRMHLIDTDYLLAYMITNIAFDVNSSLKIEIYSTP